MRNGKPEMSMKEALEVSGIVGAITAAGKVGDVRELLHRGLNTWHDAPPWLFHLHDALKQKSPG